MPMINMKQIGETPRLDCITVIGHQFSDIKHFTADI
jgi:hypothetical protein